MDFANGNLCGASLELNDVLGKLDAAKAEITAAIDSLASEATAAFGAAQNELKALTDKLQTIEIPTLPKLNLQAELKGIVSMIPGSPAFIQSLAKMKLEFGSDLEAAGLELESLVTDAVAAISGGGNVCALCPNLEKVAGSIEPAIEKATEVLQAAAPAVAEAQSKLFQNVNIENARSEIKNVITSFLGGRESIFKTNIPPTIDSPTGDIVVTPPDLVTLISTAFSSNSKIDLFGIGSMGEKITAGLNKGRAEKGLPLFVADDDPGPEATGLIPSDPAYPQSPAPVSTIKVVTPKAVRSSRSNVTTPETKAEGMTHKKKRVTEKFSLSGDVGSKIIQDGKFGLITLKHVPYDNISLYIHGGDNAKIVENDLGTTTYKSGAPKEAEKQGVEVGGQIKLGKRSFYKSFYGKHMSLLIGTAGWGPNNPTSYGLTGKNFKFEPPFTLKDHPGDINSGGLTEYLITSTVIGADHIHVDVARQPPNSDDMFIVNFHEEWESEVRGRKGPLGIMLTGDKKFNKKYKGMAGFIVYDALENYDPTMKPIGGIQGRADELAAVQKLADSNKSLPPHEVTEAREDHRTGQKMVIIKMADGQGYRGLGSTNSEAYDDAAATAVRAGYKR